MKVRIPVTLVLQPQRWQVKGERIHGQDAMRQQIAAWVEKGLRAQLQTANLLTGQKQIALEVVPGTPPATLTLEDDLMVIPSVPSETERLTEKAQAFLNKLDQAPIAQLVADLRNTVQDAGRLLSSPSLHKGIDGVGPLLDSLNRTTEAAKVTLNGATATMQTANDALGAESALRYDVARLLKELTSTARSLRSLTDFLEAHPNALILGKPAPDSQ